MYVTIEFLSDADEANAFDIVIEHSPGAVYKGPRGPKYVVQEAVLELLREAGVQFNVIGPSQTPKFYSEAAGERI
jgi:hypothetical protein